jgi:hypothetical protein
LATSVTKPSDLRTRATISESFCALDAGPLLEEGQELARFRDQGGARRVVHGIDDDLLHRAVSLVRAVAVLGHRIHRVAPFLLRLRDERRVALRRRAVEHPAHLARVIVIVGFIGVFQPGFPQLQDFRLARIVPREISVKRLGDVIGLIGRARVRLSQFGADDVEQRFRRALGQRVILRRFRGRLREDPLMDATHDVVQRRAAGLQFPRVDQVEDFFGGET